MKAVKVGVCQFMEDGSMITQDIVKQTTHQRIVVARHGGPGVLQAIEEPIPEPQAGEARVRVLAAGVSAYDLMSRSSGLLPGTPKPPFTIGEDIVGIVDKLGESVNTVELGQRVAAFTFGASGGYAESVCRSADELVPVPEGVDSAEAVCVVVNYLTAHLAMHCTAKAQRGERILVQGAAGGVGSALLELGRLAGLELYGTASSYNHEQVIALGATPIDYHNEDVVKRIHSLTNGGVDVVFDPIGGPRQLWRSHNALHKNGRLVWFGVAAAKRSGLKIIPLSLGMVALLKLKPGGRHLLSTPDLAADKVWYRQTLTELLDLLANGELKPLVAERIPLTEAARAHELLERGGYAGKIVLVNETC
jgi:NADPH:quinone reductase-like Zn-dependent oxidoreductase